MAAGWILQVIYAALIGQATVVPSNGPQPATPTPALPTNNNPSLTRPLVRTAHGDVRGIQTVSESGDVISSFLGIPYASPPVGKLRFNKPLPAFRWSGVRDASKFGNECFQHVLAGYDIQLTDEPLARSEDCLYLNVYRPEVKSSSSSRSGGSDALLPVMVWVHGGGFIFGAGSMYDGTELSANGDVIVVTINYRLEIFGYLSNGDDVIPGNYGMLDQVMALGWVKENIRSFGGDPNKVTIFGESAGSASVSLLVLSPLASGLFSRAIMESGTSLSPWGFQSPAARVSSHQMTSLIGVGVGCNQKDAKMKLDCLRNVDAETLFNASLAVGDALSLSLMLKPVVETKFGFLPDLPATMWRQGRFNRVDTIRGFNMAESGMGVLMISNYSRTITFQQFLDGVKQDLSDNDNINTDEIIKTILKDNNISQTTDGHELLLKLAQVLSDISFKGPTILEANIESAMAPGQNHYVYEFDYKSSRSKTPAWMPAVHAEEIESIFGFKWGDIATKPDKAPSTNDKLVSRLMQAMWSNFAKYGSPTGVVTTSTTTGTGNAAIDLPSWNLYIGDGAASVLRIGVNSRNVSFRNHTSARTFGKVLKELDTVIEDRFIVG